MRRQIKRHLTYANLVSTVALFIALGLGSAYAANRLAPRSVGAKQLRPGAVSADKIRKHAVTAPKLQALAVKQGKIAAAAIVASKLADGAVTSEKIAAGAVSPEKIPNDSIGGEKVNESTLGQVPKANTANTAAFATTANPEAFAKVDAEGTLFPAASKGIGVADVKQGEDPGIYCINVPGFIPTGAQVSPEYALKGSVSAYVKFGGTPSCPYPQVEVQTYNAGSLQQHPFFILLYH
jgi:hypothetical protein